MKQKVKRKGKRRIVLTGGHAATTALATAEELKKSAKIPWDIHWIGTESALEGKRAPTLGALVFPEKVAYHPIIAGRLQRRFTIWTIPSILKIPIGFVHALFILLKIRPSIILSFGGFAAFPVVFVGWLMAIPVIIHEQTSVVGRANKISAIFAKKIAISRPTSAKYFPRRKTILVGNPILSGIFKIPFKNKPGCPPTLFITAGSRGSQFINSLINQIIKELLAKFVVIHQTGYLDYEKFERVKNSLDRNLKSNYIVYSVINPGKMVDVYSQSDIVISRAGANTVSELIATKRPSILIPIPFSYKDEQNKNAQFAQKLGIAKVLPQEKLTAQKLVRQVNKVYENWSKITTSIKHINLDRKAATRLVKLVEEVSG